MHQVGQDLHDISVLLGLHPAVIGEILPIAVGERKIGCAWHLIHPAIELPHGPLHISIPHPLASCNVGWQCSDNV